MLSYSFINSYYKLRANALFRSKFELLYVFLIDMAWAGLMAGNSFFNTQLFGTFFSTTDWRFSMFSCGFMCKTENCTNYLFFKKAFTLAHQLSLNKIQCNYGFTLYKYFVSYTLGFKLKLFSIIVNIKINASKSTFLFENCLPISAWI